MYSDGYVGLLLCGRCAMRRSLIFPISNFILAATLFQFAILVTNQEAVVERARGQGYIAASMIRHVHLQQANRTAVLRVVDKIAGQALVTAL